MQGINPILTAFDAAILWNPNQTTQEEIMTEHDPQFIPMPDEAADAIMRIQAKQQELESRLNDMRAQYQQQHQLYKQGVRNVRDLAEALFKLDNEEVTDTLIECGIEPPKKDYSFTFSVTGRMTAIVSGINEEDAWEQIGNVEPDPNDIEDLEESGMGYDDAYVNETYSLDSYEIEHRFMRKPND